MTSNDDSTKKRRPNHPKKKVIAPEPAPEGRQRPHHDGRDLDPQSQKEYRAHDASSFDPHGGGD